MYIIFEYLIDHILHTISYLIDHVSYRNMSRFQCWLASEEPTSSQPHAPQSTFKETRPLHNMKKHYGWRKWESYSFGDWGQIPQSRSGIIFSKEFIKSHAEKICQNAEIDSESLNMFHPVFLFGPFIRSCGHMQPCSLHLELELNLTDLFALKHASITMPWAPCHTDARSRKTQLKATGCKTQVQI